MAKRFAPIGVDPTEEARRAYREMLFTTPDIEDHLSGVILFEESVHHASRDGRPFVRILDDRGIRVGVKVGTGNMPIPNYPGELYTEGLDGLQEQLPQMRDAGIRFTKWRAVMAIGEGRPTTFCIETNAELLARMAAISQQAGLVPIVEPEVLMDGGHGIDECFEATRYTLTSLFRHLSEHRVDLRATILKTNMVVPGSDSGRRASPEEVASATLECFAQVLPPALPGVAFLSGGQGEAEATANLNQMNLRPDLPWRLTFSYGRALLDSALHAWGAQRPHGAPAQAAFLRRVRCNGAATQGIYDGAMETASSA